MRKFSSCHRVNRGSLALPARSADDLDLLLNDRLFRHTIGYGRLGVPRAVAQACAGTHSAGTQRGQQPQRG